RARSPAPEWWDDLGDGHAPGPRALSPAALREGADPVWHAGVRRAERPRSRATPDRGRMYLRRSGDDGRRPDDLMPASLRIDGLDEELDALTALPTNLRDHAGALVQAAADEAETTI